MVYIGIDLGTTSSEACFVDDRGEPIIIPSREGTPSGKNFPSVIAFRDGKIYAGYQAKRIPSDDKVIEFKRWMGSNHRYYSKTMNKEYTPQELSAILLKKIKEDAEYFLNKEVTGVVVTVPAYFNDNQRQATKDACRIAGLKVLRLINEPTSACIAYGLGRSEKGYIAVLDLGGGTFDVSILSVSSGTFQVLATSGDTELGGCDMDNALMQYLIEKEQISLKNNIENIFREAVERAKMDLSSSESTYIYIPGVIERELTRDEFEKVIEPIIQKLKQPIMQALSDSGLTPSDIDKVVLIGGGTKVPAVRKKFAEIFGDGKFVYGVDPMRAVAIGAGIVASVLEGRWKGDPPLLIDVTPLSLGVEVKGGLMSKLINRNTPIPCTESKIFTTTTDFQNKVIIRVYQGEREFVKDNIYLGELVLDGILPAPAGVPKIKVVFEIDENGLLKVIAEDLGTKKSKELIIQASHRLTEEEIKSMIESAQKYFEEDKKRRKEIELRHEADGILKAIENLSDEHKKKIFEDVERVKRAKTVDELESALTALKEKLAQISREIYKA